MASIIFTIESVIAEFRLVIELVTPDIVLVMLVVRADVTLVNELVIPCIICVVVEIIRSLILLMASVILPKLRFMSPSFELVFVASSEVFSVESSMSFVLFFIASSF